jgi:serine phosphatase RsbU (regulator of sigma subunit)
VLAQVLEPARKALDCSAVYIALRDGDGWDIAHISAMPTAENREIRLGDCQFPLGVRVERAGKLVCGKIGANDPVLGSTGITMTAPLFTGGAVMGAIAFHSVAAHPFRANQIDFAQKLAANMSLALQNAYLYQSERAIAETLQEALLSVPDSVPDVDFRVLYRSASDAARVGGDFFDLFEVDDRRVGLVVGDVAGKGLDAAVLTSLVKHTIRAHCATDCPNPATVLEKVNDVVYRSTSLESFATVFLGVLDRDDGRLVYSNAGHTTGMVRRNADCSVGKLTANSPILGAFPVVEFRVSEACLEKNDLLLLYTDGLTEAREDKVQYGEHRLCELVSQLGPVSPGHAAERALDAASHFAKGRLHDDVAIMAIAWTPDEESSRGQCRLPL